MDDFANWNKTSTFRKWDVAVLGWREGLRTTTQPHYIIIQQSNQIPETTVTDIAWPNPRGTDVSDARWMQSGCRRKGEQLLIFIRCRHEGVRQMQGGHRGEGGHSLIFMYQTFQSGFNTGQAD